MEEAETEEAAAEDVVGKSLGEPSSVDALAENVAGIDGAQATTSVVPETAAAGSSVPMFSLAPPAEDSSDSADEDGLPSMSGGFGYWSQMLNVTKVADPLPPLTAPAKAAVRPPRPPRQSGGDYNDNRRGGPRAGKGSWKGRPAPLYDNVGSFVTWAKDPSAGDGRRRSSSRSPRRNQGERNIESFMSWAREDDETAPKEEPREESTGELGSFLAWAAEDGHDDGNIKTEEHREKGEDALAEKEERRFADEASDDDAPSKRAKKEKVEAEIAGLKKEIAAEEKSLEAAVSRLQSSGATKAEKDESDDEIDLAAMQRWRRLEDELSDDGDDTLAKPEVYNMSEAVVDV